MNILFPQILSEILWLAMLFLGSISVKFLKDLNISLGSVNNLMEVITEKINHHDQRIKEIEYEISREN